MTKKVKFFAYLTLISFLIFLYYPFTSLYAQGSDTTDIIESDGLITWDQCPYDFDFYLEDGFTKVILQHTADDGSRFKFGGWKAWVEVNGELVYEWYDFSSDTGSEWYDHTTGQYYFDEDLDSDQTEITDYVEPGNNTLTFYHYNEGPGSGILIEVNYPASGTEEDNGDSHSSTENGSSVSDDQSESLSEDVSSDQVQMDEEESPYSSEQLILDESLDFTEDRSSFNIKALDDEEVQSLVFNFKSRYVDIDNPSYVFGRDVPSLTEEASRQYTRSALYSKFLGPAGYMTPATSWEDVARLALIESKVHYDYAQRIGYFKSLYNILSVFYIEQSFRQSLNEIPKQFNTLKSFKSAEQLVKNSDTIVSLASNLSGIYETVIAVDRQGAEELGFPELDPKVMFVIGAVTSGGWSVLGDISKATFVDNAKYSINYEVKKALLNSSIAYHAQKTHDIALKEMVGAEDIGEFYFHARRIAVLKQLDCLLNIEDSISLWQKNPDLVTTALDFLNIISKDAALGEDIALYNELFSNYESAESYLLKDMDELGLN